ncbi:MAG: DsrE family protein [Chitinophagaceae bacterium]
MKLWSLLAVLCLLAPALAAQTTPYDVVFDLTSKDTAAHKTVIRWINGITATNPDARLEVVLYGQSVDMVIKDRSVVAEALQQIGTNKNVVFTVCAASLKRHNIDQSRLLPGIAVVPDGIYQIVKRQKEGWGYIKVAQ